MGLIYKHHLIKCISRNRIAIYAERFLKSVSYFKAREKNFSKNGNKQFIFLFIGGVLYAVYSV